MSNSLPASSTNLTPAMRSAAQTMQWKESIRQALADARVAVPGTIVSFNSVLQTAVIQVALREKVYDPTKGTVDVAIAPLQDVPVIMPHGGGCSLTFPLVNGDECLLVFADMCVDLWWVHGGLQNQFEKRRHDLSDAFCIPGPWSQAHKLTDYSVDSVQLRSDDRSAYVDVQPNQVTISGADAIDITSPAVTVVDGLGGTAQKLMTDTFYQWYITNVQPFLVSKGYAGPVPPVTGCETTVLKGQ